MHNHFVKSATMLCLCVFVAACAPIAENTTINTSVQENNTLQVAEESLTSCQVDSDCELVANACCAMATCNYTALNAEHSDKWEQLISASCDSPYCPGVTCDRYRHLEARCVDNQCAVVDNQNGKCQFDSECIIEWGGPCGLPRSLPKNEEGSWQSVPFNPNATCPAGAMPKEFYYPVCATNTCSFRGDFGYRYVLTATELSDEQRNELKALGVTAIQSVAENKYSMHIPIKRKQDVQNLTYIEEIVQIEVTDKVHPYILKDKYPQRTIQDNGLYEFYVKFHSDVEEANAANLLNQYAKAIENAESDTYTILLNKSDAKWIYGDDRVVYFGFAPQICPAVCMPAWYLSDNCSKKQCGSGCGADNIGTFGTPEQCLVALEEETEPKAEQSS